MKEIISVKTNKGMYNISLEDIIRIIKKPKRESIEAVEMRIENAEGIAHVAHADIDEDFPSISVDGFHSDRQFYLANVEMPNECYPDSFTARLYAGCVADETDSPVAFVRTSVTREFGDDQTQNPLTKLVYVDDDIAEKRTWRGPRFPEHREDEKK